MVEKCCCRFSLRTGCRLIATLTICAGIITLIICLVELAYLNEIKDTLFQSQLDYCEEDCIDFILSLIKYSATVSLLVFIPYMLVAALMIYGVKKNEPKLLSPYLYYTFLFIVGLIVFLIVNIVYFKARGAFIAGSVMGIISVICLHIYFAVVVKSLKDRLADPESFEDVPSDDEVGFSLSRV